MLDHIHTAVSFPDSLISRSQCLAGTIERRSPSVSDLHGLVRELPAEASTPARLVVRQVLMRVFGRFATALDTALDATSIQAFVTWSAGDPASEHWRGDVFDLVGVWTAAKPRCDSTPVTEGVADVRIRHALEALDGRYAEPGLALADIARVARLSRCEAARLLKKHTGRGFVAHLHQRRIAASRVHMNGTTLSIKEIGARVGYKSASEFGRHFRKSLGLTPREYRAARALGRGGPRTISH